MIFGGRNTDGKADLPVVWAGAINLSVDYLTGNYWPIAIEKVDENNRSNITNASPPPVKRTVFQENIVSKNYE